MRRPALVAVAVVLLAAGGVGVWLSRRPSGKTTEAAASGSAGSAAIAGGGTGAAGIATGGTGAGTGDLVEAEPPPTSYRVIDADARMALKRRIEAARAARAENKPVPPEAAPDPTDPPPVRGMLTSDDILAGITPILPLLEECYQEALTRKSVTKGQVTFSLDIVGDKEVGSLIDTAEIGGDPAFLADTELMQCMQETIMSIELPPLAETSFVKTSVSMLLSPDDEADGGSGAAP
jgi:hypothetical protein